MANVGGKYKSVLHKLKKLERPTDPYQERVEFVKTELRANGMTTPSRLASRYDEFRKQQIEIQEQLSAANLNIEAITQLLIESQERGDAGWGEYGAAENTYRMVNGNSIRIQPEPYLVIEDPATFRQWCLKEDLLTSMSLPWQTAASLAKERLLHGESEPDGTRLYMKSKIVYRVMDRGEPEEKEPITIEGM